MSETRWLKVPDFDRYEVGDNGLIRVCATQHVLVCGDNGRGYLQVTLCQNKRRKTHRLHRLIAAAFVECQPGKDEVNHKDGDKRNNRASNLEWVTRAENCAHNGLMGRCRAATNPNKAYALSVEDVADIRRRYAAGERSGVIHKSYPCVTRSYLNKVARGLSRTFEPGGVNRAKPRLTSADHASIRNAFAAGSSREALAAKYNITASHVRDIASGRRCLNSANYRHSNETPQAEADKGSE